MLLRRHQSSSRRCRAPFGLATAAAASEAAASAGPSTSEPLFEWEQAFTSAPERPIATDLPAADGPALSVEGAAAALQRVASSGAAPPDAWMAEALQALQPRLQGAEPAALLALLEALAAVRCAPARPWCDAALAALRPRLPGLDSRQLAAAVWAVGELGAEPSPEWAAAAHAAVAAALPDFYAPDLARVACAVGSWEAAPPAAWAEALASEAAFQLKSFAADFNAADLARLATGDAMHVVFIFHLLLAGCLHVCIRAAPRSPPCRQAY